MLPLSYTKFLYTFRSISIAYFLFYWSVCLFMHWDQIFQIAAFYKTSYALFFIPSGINFGNDVMWNLNAK